MAPHIIKFEHQQELFSWAAENFLAVAHETLKSKAWFDVALSGGTTAQGLFSKLAQKAQGLSLLSQIRFFLSDERALGLESPDSNAGNAWRQLLTPLGISRHSFFCPYDASSPPQLAAQNYERLLKNLLGFNQDHVPVFDMVYLGIGQDGHTASIFPHSSLLKNIASDPRLVAATDEEIAGLRRITFMPRLINAARNICVMAVGQGKAQVIDRILNGPLLPEELPAQLIMRSGQEGITLALAEMNS